jgi:hypothetical protein
MRRSCKYTLFLISLGMSACSISAMGQVLDAALPLQYVPLPTPCRAADTRFGGTPIAAGTVRNFDPGSGGCAGKVPASSPIAYAANVTVVPHGPLSYVTIFPEGESQPNISLLNAPDGQVKSNAAIVTGGTNGGISLYASGATEAILDISGYFIQSQFPYNQFTYFAATPCRLVDTRGPAGQFGGPSLVAGAVRQFALEFNPNCDVQPAKAYSLNITLIPKGGKPVRFLTVWGPRAPVDNGQPNIVIPPPTSIVNALTGNVTANAAIVTVDGDNEYSVAAFASEDADLIIDLDGYFDAPSQGKGTALSLYTLLPCRVADTRQSIGAFSGQHTFPMTTGVNCSVPGNAQALVINATVVPTGPLGYLTLWPGGTQPVVSTLNAANGAITSNMAIVPTANGSIDAFAPTPTQLILDVSSYFAP